MILILMKMKYEIFTTHINLHPHHHPARWTDEDVSTVLFDGGMYDYMFLRGIND